MIDIDVPKTIKVNRFAISLNCKGFGKERAKYGDAPDPNTPSFIKYNHDLIALIERMIHIPDDLMIHQVVADDEDTVYVIASGPPAIVGVIAAMRYTSDIKWFINRLTIISVARELVGYTKADEMGGSIDHLVNFLEKQFSFVAPLDDEDLGMPYLTLAHKKLCKKMDPMEVAKRFQSHFKGVRNSIESTRK